MIEWLSSTSFWTLLNWESVAVVAALAYVWLAAKENILCWFFALITTSIYTLLFWNVSLLMESALNVYYIVMAIYGWWQWQSVTTNHQPRQIHRWPLHYHLYAVVGVVAISLISGWLLQKFTGAALPYLDSFTTWASVFTTWMVARKVLENWIYWIVIDVISIYLYIDRELYQTAGLFVLYIGFASYGWYCWNKTLKQSQTATAKLDTSQRATG